MSATIHEYIKPSSTPNGSTAGTLPNHYQDSQWQRFKAGWRIVAAAKTWSIPTWAATVFLGVLLTTGGVIYWRLSDKLQESHDSNVRMEQALTDLKDSLGDKLRPVERQGLLNDEHQRSVEKDFAEFQGYVKGRLGDKPETKAGRQ